MSVLTADPARYHPPVSRLPVPGIIRDLYRNPADGRTLLVAVISLAAAGLDPRAFHPGLVSVQAAVRARPEAEQILLIAAVVGAVMLLVGGVLGDVDGRRRLHLGALGVLVVAGVSGLLFSDGPVFLLGRLVGAAMASLILPFALAGIAVTYRGVARATAIGVGYAVYGGASAVAPVLLTLFGPSGPRWPAFVASIVVSTGAFAIARRGWRDLPSPSRPQGRRVIATGMWAAGIIVTCMVLLGSANGSNDPLRIAFLLLGLGTLGLAAVVERGAKDREALQVERRPVAMALFVGFIIAFAQAMPLLQMPLYFQLLSGYGPILAGIAITPFVIALVITGPVTGILLRRLSPRPLITFGVGVVGAGNLLLAIVLAPSASYLSFIAPFALIGSGFVIATTVRTAIIFASVPRGLPATAAALNEASVALGTRAGLVVGTLVISTLALSTYADALAGQPQGTVDVAVASFQELLTAIGTPGYGALVEGAAGADRLAYAAAYTDAVRTMLLATGIVTVGSAIVTWFLVRSQQPLTTVWEHRDERVEATA